MITTKYTYSNELKIIKMLVSTFELSLNLIVLIKDSN